MPELDTRTKAHTCPQPTGLLVGILVMAVLMICAFVFSYFAWDRFSDIAADRIRLDIAVKELDRINEELEGQVKTLETVNGDTLGTPPFFYIEDEALEGAYNLHRIDPRTAEDTVITSFDQETSDWFVFAIPRHGYTGMFVVGGGSTLGDSTSEYYLVDEASPDRASWQRLGFTMNQSVPWLSPDETTVAVVIPRTSPEQGDSVQFWDLVRDVELKRVTHTPEEYLYEYVFIWPEIALQHNALPSCLTLTTFTNPTLEAQQAAEAQGLLPIYNTPVGTQEFCLN